MATRSVQRTIERGRPIAYGSMIVRVEHDREKPYLMISKATLADHTMSFEARGFLAFLLTKPDNWRIRVDQLAEETGLSQATVYRLLNKLIDAHYARRELPTRRKPDGTFQSGSLYWIFERPELAGSIPNESCCFDDAGIPF